MGDIKLSNIYSRIIKKKLKKLKCLLDKALKILRNPSTKDKIDIILDTNKKKTYILKHDCSN